MCGFYMMAERPFGTDEENTSMSSGSQSPDLGYVWRDGCPKSPEWSSDVDSWSESEGFSSSDFREHSVESLSLHVVGLYWSGKRSPLEDWKLRGWL